MKLVTTLAASAAIALTATAPSMARDLTIVGFGGGYQDSARETLFKGYQEATGTTVVDDVYNGEMAKIYGMVETGNVTYDAIMVEAPELVRGCEDGVFAKNFGGEGAFAAASGAMRKSPVSGVVANCTPLKSRILGSRSV